MTQVNDDAQSEILNSAWCQGHVSELKDQDWERGFTLDEQRYDRYIHKYFKINN